MIFNSREFLVFFSLFFFLYWFMFKGQLKAQNLFLLIASYAFYAWWDWRFLALLIGLSTVNFYLGIFIEQAHLKRKRLLVITCLIVGLGTLMLFKYYNFFISSLILAFNIKIEDHWLNVLLPLGISFYIFRMISYVLDINHGKIKACKDGVVFFCYVAFFPSLISGPIDRAKTFFPQLESTRVFDVGKAKDGLLQILWGLFKKMVIADNCASFTNNVFDDYAHLPGSTLLLACFLYTIQVYADFSGYSDMAIGIARLLGFEITKNFDFPLFSQSIKEFWRKWHMSLTSWITDYVFMPLTILFRDFSKMGMIMAVLINFSLIGMWHGNKWTFVFFGFVHGLYFVALIIIGTLNKKIKIYKNKLLPSLSEFLNMIFTFAFVMFTFVIFRSESVMDSFNFYGKMLSFSLFSMPEISSNSEAIKFFLVIGFLIAEWI